jgi:hypothetical protein
LGVLKIQTISVVVFFPLVPHGKNVHRVARDDFKERHIARGSKRDEELS